MPQRAKVPAAQDPSPTEQAVQRIEPVELAYVPARQSWQVATETAPRLDE